MKIALLSRDKKLYSTKCLVEAAESHGYEIIVVDILKYYMNQMLNDIDAVIPRLGASGTSGRI